MKVLFVGEGSHDVGRKDGGPIESCQAGGVVAELARRVVPGISSKSIALRWTDLPRYPVGPKRGFDAKVMAAIVVGARRFGCHATVCVADRDRDQKRGSAMTAGRARALALVADHRVVCGLAVESIEAWTLGAEEALAAELGLDPARLRSEYPAGVRVEELHEGSGLAERRPKGLLDRIAELGHATPDTAFREAVARRTEVAALERSCPAGFGQFAAELRRELGATLARSDA